jgi:Rrf2 family protein
MVSQKCQYALRAIFELAKRYGKGPVRIGDIARAQAIPPRFLEVILNQLRQAGFVESRRGNEGGYFLARAPARLTVGEIVRFVEGPIRPVTCTPDSTETVCSLHSHCVFQPMWEKIRTAISDVYDHTTFQELVDEEIRMSSEYLPTFTI